MTSIEDLFDDDTTPLYTLIDLDRDRRALLREAQDRHGLTPDQVHAAVYEGRLHITDFGDRWTALDALEWYLRGNESSDRVDRDG